MKPLPILLVVACLAPACGGSSGSTPTTPTVVAPTPTPTPNLPRSTVDRDDEVAGYQVKIVYALPGDAPDENLDTNGALAGSVRTGLAWLKTASGGKTLKVDTAQGGALDILFLRVPIADAAGTARGTLLRNDLETYVRSLPLYNPTKLYLVYWGGGNNATCGNGAFPPGLVGRVSAMWLKGAVTGFATCASQRFAVDGGPATYWEYVFVHEVFHTLGASPVCGASSNRSSPAHTSDSPSDLMYSGSAPWTPSILDVNKDDYWGHTIPNCLDLSNSVFMTPTNPGAQPPPGW